MTKNTRKWIDTNLTRHTAGLIDSPQLARVLAAEHRAARGRNDRAYIARLIAERVPGLVKRLPNGALIAA